MFKRLSILFILLLSLPFITGMGAKPKATPQKAEAEKEARGLAAGMQSIITPHEYGNVIIKNYTGEGKPLRAVVFSHWLHRTQYTCKVCHGDLGFSMKAGATNIKESDIVGGRFCGKCHNGTAAFAATECDRCHSDGIVIKENRNFYEFTKGFPSDSYGNKINWVKAIDEGKFNPKTSLQGDEQINIKDVDVKMALDVKMVLKEPVMPNVHYPHKSHTQILGCSNCHPNIFRQQAGTNPMTMNKIFGGEYCGVCHGRVAFPFEDCFRCHSSR
jgi:c(7)-type cytochrome triheme protein